MSAGVVIAHDYLTQRGGAERVVLSLLRAFPGARVVTSVYDPENTFPEFADYDIQTSWLNRVRPLRRDPRRALPFLASAFSGLEIRDAEVVIASSSGWAHAVKTGDIPKIVYCHNPPRWLHQRQDYFAGQPRHARFAGGVLHRRLVRWDQMAASTATAYVANSSVVRERILSAYGIDADVIAPPFGIDPSGPQEPVPGVQPGFLLTVSRNRGYKNTSVVCEAVEQLPAERLVVVGGLPAREYGSDWSPRLTGATDVSDAQLRWLYANCAALVAMSHEDFGLTPIEANAFGRPAVCLRAGGYLDTLRPGRTGVFAHALTVEATVDAIKRVQGAEWSSAAIASHAERYSPAVFASRLRSLADEVRAERIPVAAATDLTVTSAA